MTDLFSPLFMILNYLLNILNDDLKKISYWAYQRKMSFNLDLSKQGEEWMFSWKASRVDHPVVTSITPLLHELLAGNI